LTPLAPLAVSLGDPAGVGPELLCEAWARREAETLPPFFAVGGGELLKRAAIRRGLDIAVARMETPEEAAERFDEALPVLGDYDGAYTPGEPDRAGAERALASLSLAVGLVRQGAASGVVTGPVSKIRLAEVGFGMPGQTEFVASACGVDPRDAVMLLVGPSLRTVPLTVHNALSEVPRLVTEELIVRKARIVAAAMIRDFGIARPRLAITGLNPHAGEGGQFGDEEMRVIEPAIAALRAEGIEASGPHPADALFTARARSTYDVALCMYHDQALVPLKALDFDRGVNMTLGLPLVRTSPDHGTAFAIAGTGTADPGATIAAIRLAGECAARRMGT
jgi:4-hydroxythreonine-4-phosphate dehydrogenase